MGYDRCEICLKKIYNYDSPYCDICWDRGLRDPVWFEEQTGTTTAKVMSPDVTNSKEDRDVPD